MIVVGDGQVAVGEDVRGKIDFMAFDNKAFLLNCLDFLLGGESLIHIRAKDIQYHSLDLKKVKGNEWNIRLINLVLPVLVILFWGIIRQRIRMHRNRKISA
jgi:ABC-type uncharacterized transport system involved in gliding motility auxiliary subunit